MLSLLQKALKLCPASVARSRSPRTQSSHSRPSLASRARITRPCVPISRWFTTQQPSIAENVAKVSGTRAFVPRSQAPRPGQQSAASPSKSIYSSDKVHLMPDVPHLWAGGAVPREQFLVLLNDLLAQQYWSPAARIYAQLVYQTHHDKNVASEEYMADILQDQLPPLPLPNLSSAELFGVFESLRHCGLNQHALALWKHYDKESHHGKALLKPHVHYYSQAFEKPYTTSFDVHNLQLLISVLEVANLVGDAALVDKVFERLAGGLIDNVKLSMVSKAEIPSTPLWHTSYRRQLNVLEIGLRQLDPKTQGQRIIEYITTFRLKFATSWTPLFLTRLYSLLESVKTHEPSLTETADALVDSIKALAFKIGAHTSLQAIWNDPCEQRILASQPIIHFDKDPSFGLNSSSPTYIHAPSSGTARPGATQPHPGLTNIIAHIAELDNHPSKENYHVIKQLYLECMEVPYYFQDTTSIVEPALKHFIAGDDTQQVSWLYQKCLEQDIGLSANARNALMFWALRKKSDPAQCIEFFNDMQVALGPQSANAATILLLFEAIQARKDLDAAVNALDYVLEHISSWTILKQGMETTLLLTFEMQDLPRLQRLADQMAVYIPRTYSERWRPRIVEYLLATGESWEPPTVVASERPSFL